jgi:predicted transcriptional regulator
MSRVARTPSITLSTRVSQEVAAAVQRIAEREDRSPSYIMARILRAEMERIGELDSNQPAKPVS